MGISCATLMKTLPKNILLVYEVEEGGALYSFVTNMYVRGDNTDVDVVAMVFGVACVLRCGAWAVVNIVMTHQKVKQMKKNRKGQ